MTSGRNACDMSKQNLHSGPFNYFLPTLRKFLVPLKFHQIGL